MTKKEQQRRREGKKEQQAKQRRHNEEFPAAAGVQKALHRAQRFERIAENQGIVIAKSERRKMRNLKYKERRHNRKPIIKTIASWLVPPKTKEEKAKDDLKTNMAVVEKIFTEAGRS